MILSELDDDVRYIKSWKITDLFIFFPYDASNEQFRRVYKIQIRYKPIGCVVEWAMRLYYDNAKVCQAVFSTIVHLPTVKLYCNGINSYKLNFFGTKYVIPLPTESLKYKKYNIYRLYGTIVISHCKEIFVLF